MASTTEDRVEKENALPTSRAKHSRIPRPTRAALSVVQPTVDCSEGPPQKGPANRTAVSSGRSRSRVKAVPNFSKIHRKWQGNLQKVREENRKTPVVVEFTLTPRGKFKSRRKTERESATPTSEGGVGAKRERRGGMLSSSVHKEEHGRATDEVSPWRRREETATPCPDKEARPDSEVTIATGGTDRPTAEEFRSDPQSLQSILKGPPNVMLDRRATELGLTRCQDKYAFDNLLRLSVHRKRKPPATAATPSQSGKSSTVNDRIQELYEQVMRASLVRSKLRVGKQEGGAKKELGDIKLNLNTEFSRVAEPTPLSRTAPLRDCPSTPQQSSFLALPQQPPQLTNSTHPLLPHTPFTPTAKLSQSMHKATPVHIITPMRATPKPNTVPLTVGAKVLLHEWVDLVAERHTFYEEEPELCSIIQGIQPHVAAERAECSDPVAKVLDGLANQNTDMLMNSQRHFVPISQH